MDFPRITLELINPYAGGPFGAKGLGELPMIGAAPAFAAAVEQAIGKKIDRIPVTPEYIRGVDDMMEAISFKLNGQGGYVEERILSEG